VVLTPESTPSTLVADDPNFVPPGAHVAPGKLSRAVWLNLIKRTNGRIQSLEEDLAYNALGLA